MKSTARCHCILILAILAGLSGLCPVQSQKDSNQFIQAPIGQNHQEVPLFEVSKSLKIEADSLIKRYALLKISVVHKEQLQKSRPFDLTLTLPSTGIRPSFTIQLQRTNLFANTAMDQGKGRSVFYNGIISGDPLSLVTINVTPSGISGIIADSTGQMIIQPHSSIPETSYIFYESDVISKSLFSCHTNTATYDISQVQKYQKSSSTTDTVLIYFECDYDMFIQNNSSVTETEDYLLGLFNEVASIYDIESITMMISDYKIWSSPDPYNDNSAQHALTSFQSAVESNFEGHLAHLLSGSPNENGGLAVINSLCEKTTAHSYSNIEGVYQTGMAYSWDVHVVTHELGHNLGSPHTHDCVWGPAQDLALDDCAVGGSCDPGPPPIDGGTIMSYCHTTNDGINFSHGFGIEPGNLIRSIIGTCPDLDGYICDLAIELTGSGSVVALGPSFGHGAIHGPAQHANWYRFTAPAQGTVSINSCYQEVDTRLYMYEGSCTDLVQVNTSDDDCTSGGGYNYASEILSQSVEAGITYYFEWDDRWSDEGFEFEFLFDSDDDICENANQIPAQITVNSAFHSQSPWGYDGAVMDGAILRLSSQMALELEPGFQIDVSASLIMAIESCEEFQENSNN